MSDANDSEPKIIVDEDWKTRVQREKEAARQQAASGPGPEAGSQRESGPSPPATFETLVSLLATQAMAAMGAFGPVEGQAEPRADLRTTRHLIDILGVLEEKTRGNLTRPESEMLSSVLHDLRWTFVQLSSHGGGSAAEERVDPES